jgi:hypothetical protein
VERAIVDERAAIGAGARVGKAGGALTLVGRGATAAPGSRVPAGGRVAPEDA